MLHNNRIQASDTMSDHGRLGKAIEMCASGRDYVQKQNAIDAYLHRLHVEVKTGSGELGTAGGKLIKGCSKIIYIPVVLENADGTVDLSRQEGFYLERGTFLKILNDLGLIREKTSTAGRRVMSIQTIWNRKQGKPHSLKKFNLLMDALYDNCISTLDELLEEEGLLMPTIPSKALEALR